MNQPGYDEDLLTHLQRVLTEFLSESGELILRTEPGFRPGVEALNSFVLNGGKRVRPTFAWWAWRGAGGDPSGESAEGVLRAVASLELLQACALIHDDLMDSSDSRRGFPTVHVNFAKKHADHGWLGSSVAFGSAAAILIGDLALAWADDMFAEAPLAGEMLAAARPAWRAIRSEVLAGQYLDVRAQATGDESVDTALRIAELKTAAYTVRRPLHLGAALAGANQTTIDALGAVGNDIGIAFQLRDDLLGVFGDPSITGKPAGDDLREGKRTLLVALGLRNAAAKKLSKQTQVISESIGDTALTDAEVNLVREALIKVGAVQAVEDRIEELADRALRNLRLANLTEPATTRLAELAIKATQRDY
jgi:geranylgeranyl diphosphate synthase type I